MKILLLGLLILSASCAKQPSRFWITPELQGPVTLFFESAAERGLFLAPKNLVVEFGTLSPGQAGTCNKHEERDVWGWVYAEQNTVTISPEEWARHSEFQRTNLIFHELGHCVLGAEHSADFRSFMYPKVSMDALDFAWSADELFLNLR